MTLHDRLKEFHLIKIFGAAQTTSEVGRMRYGLNDFKPGSTTTTLVFFILFSFSKLNGFWNDLSHVLNYHCIHPLGAGTLFHQTVKTTREVLVNFDSLSS